MPDASESFGMSPYIDELEQRIREYRKIQDSMAEVEATYLENKTARNNLYKNWDILRRTNGSLAITKNDQLIQAVFANASEKLKVLDGKLQASANVIKSKQEEMNALGKISKDDIVNAFKETKSKEDVEKVQKMFKENKDIFGIKDAYIDKMANKRSIFIVSKENQIQNNVEGKNMDYEQQQQLNELLRQQEEQRLAQELIDNQYNNEQQKPFEDYKEAVDALCNGDTPLFQMKNEEEYKPPEGINEKVVTKEEQTKLIDIFNANMKDGCCVQKKDFDNIVQTYQAEESILMNKGLNQKEAEKEALARATKRIEDLCKNADVYDPKKLAYAQIADGHNAKGFTVLRKEEGKVITTTVGDGTLTQEDRMALNAYAKKSQQGFSKAQSGKSRMAGAAQQFMHGDAQSMAIGSAMLAASAVTTILGMLAEKKNELAMEALRQIKAGEIELGDVTTLDELIDNLKNIATKQLEQQQEQTVDKQEEPKEETINDVLENSENTKVTETRGDDEEEETVDSLAEDVPSQNSVQNEEVPGQINMFDYLKDNNLTDDLDDVIGELGK